MKFNPSSARRHPPLSRLFPLLALTLIAAPSCSEDGSPSVAVTPEKLDFGSVKCASRTDRQPIEVRNVSDVPLDYEIKLADKAPLEIEGPATGKLGPGETATVSVAGHAVDLGEVGGDVFVLVNGETVKTVHATVVGAGSRADVSQSTVALGEVQTPEGGSSEVTVRNTGTDPLTITDFGGQTDAFHVTWDDAPKPLVVPPGTDKTVRITLAAGTESSVTATMTPVVDGPTCGTLPSIVASGRLIKEEVTLSVADFGKVPCQTAANTTKELVITNHSTSALAISALALPESSAFTYAGSTTVAIPAGSAAAPTTGSLVLKLKTPLGLPRTVEEEIPLNIGSAPALPSPNAGKRTTKARIDIRGAVLSVTPASLAFSIGCTWNYTGAHSWVRSCTAQTQNVKVRNMGNEPFNLKWNLTGANLTGWTVPNAQVLKPSDTTTAAAIRFDRTGDYYGFSGTILTSFAASMNAAADPQLCNPGQKVTLTGAASP